MKNKKKPLSKGTPKKQTGTDGGFTSSVLRPDCFTILSEKNTVSPSVDLKTDKKLLIKMYTNMVFTRAFDERCMMLQRQGRIGFYVPSYGQEAIQTGTAAALTNEDWVFPSYREPGIFLYRGASIYEMLCNCWGNDGDLCKGRQMPVHYSFPKIKIFSVSSPISTQVIQAVGASLASQLRKEDAVSATYFGDGGTSENDFHTGLTFAGAYKTPTIFICTNNQFAISVPVKKQTGAQRISDKAIGYGMPGVAVDGNDVLAIYKTMAEAVQRARRGDGPTLIECFTFRMGPHSSSDDPSRYRDETKYQAWLKRDPIKRFKEYLVGKDYWSESEETKLSEDIKARLAEAIEKAEATPNPSLESLFDDVYAKLTPQLQKQKAELVKEGELRGKFENTSEAFPL